MHSLWLIARYEYRRIAGHRSFIISTLALPVLIVGLMALIVIVEEGAGGNRTPIGYVDESGLLAPASPQEDDADEIPVLRFSDLAAGQEAVRAGQVQALFVVPKDYLTQPAVDLFVFEEDASDRVWRRWNAYLRQALLSGYPEEVRDRVTGDVDVLLRDASGRKEIDEGNIVGILVPMVSAILFMVTAMMSSGYLLQAVVSEKENRTMEVMVTSVTPGRLIAGKTVGLMAVALTQMAIWAVTLAAALTIAARVSEDLPLIAIPWGTLGLSMLYFLPSFALLAGVMVAIGGVVDEARHAQSLSGPLTLPFILPFTLIPVVLGNPNGLFVTIMTMFPTTSFLTIAVRSAFGVVPVWQMVVAWVLLVASAGASVWLAGKVFRLGMLLYGQRLSFRDVAASLRGEQRSRAEAGR